MAGRNLVRLDVDVSRAGKKLFKLEKKIEQGTRLTVQEVGELGKNKARALAPYWSGETFRNIILRKGKDSICILCNQKIEAPTQTEAEIPEFCECGLQLPDNIVFLLKRGMPAHCPYCGIKVKLPSEDEDEDEF